MKIISMLVWLLGMAMPSWAELPDSDIKRLQQDLTPLGAERAGNGSTIPAWTGGLPQDQGPWETGFHPDPYAGEKPLLRIDAGNLGAYQDQLTEGQRQLLQRYPDMYLNVYPSHRSASYPDSVYDAIQSNAATAQLLPYGSGVTGAVMSSPFPIPANGLEVLWNHTLRFRGQTVSYEAVSSLITTNGQRMDTLREYNYYFKYSEADIKSSELENKIFLLTRKTLAPAHQAGSLTLVHETLDQMRARRKSWVYTPGARRLRRTPDLAYDTPDPNSQSLRTIDQVDMFNGAPDYYDWDLQGKQEIYIPYNAYRVHQGDLALDDILAKHHLNPALLRYELHRVWVIEANLRVGFSHRYSKRRYYLDEDSWSIVYAEEYDQHGALIQMTEGHLINYYDMPLMMTTLEVTYDFPSGRYYTEGLDNERPRSFRFFDTGLNESDFSTNAIRRQARR
ncbi:DUF1329 domain-containing protein [Oceanobacter sp. 2_MG-2023]|uniref:DUF1329 domain-containing protein n=3 Tax=Gammaproteobacteria TaxID=1236 RepID=UPI002735EEB0|nr:DUF1329 domain-containing protein [Oceanobacter sp. 2_MG-2023]MDP2609144.1 DUF1329 domain-containing protein [Oceanobacter sp. 1_MG-2023]MDP2612564.1 DUF1329 domain-containing protein [Oceanobacter sp. 2_MG-2023]